HWQAADVFLVTPTPGPGRLMIGARKAVEVLLVLPSLLVVSAACIWIGGGVSSLFQLLPGILALPIFSRISGISSDQLPLSLPGEEAKAAGRGLLSMVAMISAMAVGGAAAVAQSFGYFNTFLIVEAVIALTCALLMDSKIRSLRWNPLESAYGGPD
ncbi:MAG: hypothetical protein ABIT37_04440, partial [Luteolibacter sp.]